MKKEELITMVGNEEQAEYAIEIVLKQIKKDFVRNAIKLEIASVENRIKELKKEGIVYSVNGSEKINWNPNKNSDKQYEADRLLYKRNRLLSMICAR